MRKIVQVVLFLLLSVFIAKAQTLSRFDFEDPAFDERIATVGPNAISSGSLANARATGNGTPQGCAAGVTPQFTGGCFTAGGCRQNINMIVPNTGNLFNVPNPTMSIDYRRPTREIDGWFWLKDQLAYGVRFSKFTARYSYDNGLGGCVPQIEFAAYPPAWDWSTNGLWSFGGAAPSNGEIPVDGVWRTVGFSYDPTTGIAAITINNPAHTELNFGVAGMPFCGWTASDMLMFNGLDNGATGITNVTAFLDNAAYGRITVTPVLLEYFNGEQNGLGVDLHWKTANEQENMGFILYRSNDAASWVEFARVDGNSTTDEPNAYTVRDKTPFRGSNFYRLVQVDMNGATTGYPAVKVEMNYTGQELLSIFPNPVTEGLLKVKFESQSDNAPLKVNILDLRGQLVHTQVFTMRSGINELDVDVSNLPAGMYIATVNNAAHTYSQKFSVMTGN
ncbi:MAG TPA: T9SS type A sorting domain-containing protein [Bacteroidia bacterium]|nr:T9SS type A sorting domain-containing protein [Bacteroidia bacterium]